MSIQPASYPKSTKTKTKKLTQESIPFIQSGVPLSQSSNLAKEINQSFDKNAIFSNNPSVSKDTKKSNESNKTITNLNSSIRSDKDQPEFKNFLYLRIKSDLEILDESVMRFPLTDLLKSILRIKGLISNILKAVLLNEIFQIIVFLVIFANTIVLCLENPNWTSLPSPYNSIELAFTCFYTAELGMKVIAYGLFSMSYSYFRSWWDLLEFTIVVTGWINIYVESGILIQAVRYLRIIRPFRSIQVVKGMRIIFLAIVNAAWPLFSALFFLFFFIFIFAIIGVELWMNSLKGRCLDIETGLIKKKDYICGSSTCLAGEECVSQLDNPNYGLTHHDNILISLITVFQIISLEGWTNNLVNAQTASGTWCVIYFLPLIFIAANLLEEFVQAIISMAFIQTAGKMLEDNSKNAEGLKDEIIESVFKKIREKEDSSREKNKEENENPLEICMDLELVDLDLQEFTENSFEKNEELELDWQFKTGFLLLERFQSEKIIKKNSIFLKNSGDKRLEFKKKSVGAGDMLTMKLSSISKDSFFNKNANKTKKNNTEKEDLNIIKSMLTINGEKLVFLVKNPGFLKHSVFQLTDFYSFESTSAKNIRPNYQKSSPSGSNPRYREPNLEDPLLISHKNSVKSLYKKHHECQNQLALFKKVSIKTSAKHSFFLLSKNCKNFINEKNQEFKNDPLDYSGPDVSPDSMDYHLLISEKCSLFTFNIWKKGLLGTAQKLQSQVFSLINHKLTSYSILASIGINTIILSLERYEISQNEENALQVLNLFFTYLFAVELALKIVAFNPVKFIRDYMNIFDSLVVAISLIEIFILASGSNALNSFRAIKVLRIFRVLRVVKLFRYLRSLAEIINAINKSLSNIGYLFMLLALFQIIFTLIGMQIFQGKFQFRGQLPRGNFDSFHWAFVTTFQVLTTENWNDILTSSLKSQAGPASCFFLIVWIVLGKYILLNLFLAILLEGFEGDEKDPTVAVSKDCKLKSRIKELEEYIEEDTENIELEKLVLETEDVNSIAGDRSFFIFSSHGFFRSFCYRAATSQNFEYFMLVFILLNSLKLVSDTYTLNSSSESLEIQVSNGLDTVFTILFNIEFFIKATAFGFIFSQDAYLKNNWNKLDFIILIFCNIDLAFTDFSIPIIKVFRMFRTLRPLKLIKHNPSLKIIINALFESIVGIINVWVLVFLVFLIFSILGVSLLAGKQHSCSFPDILDKASCVSSGHEWAAGRFNFDNVVQGGIVLFVLMSQESWPQRMLEGVDAKAVGLAPETNANPAMCYFYIVIVFISNFVMLNLFTCIMFNKFQESKNNESYYLSSMFNSPDQVLWSKIQEHVVKAKPSRQKLEPTSRLKSCAHRISKSKNLEFFVFGVILVNMLSMALPYSTASNEYNSAIDYVNIICAIVFIVEAVVKVAALGTYYFQKNWNIFDFFIACFSFVDLVVTGTSGIRIALLRQVPIILRIIRIFRVFRLIRLVKTLKTIENLLVVIFHSLPAVLNVFGVIVFIFFIYAILGCYLFNNVGPNVGITNWYNFSNFHNSMNILWRISTGEDYPSIMLDTVVAQNNYGNVIYFISFIVIINFSVFDLFVTITMQYFEEFYLKSNPSALFKSDFKIFKSRWREETQENMWKITKEAFIRLIGKLGSDFNFLKSFDRAKVIKLILALNVEYDEKEMFYFNDVLYAVLRRRYDKKVNRLHQRFDYTIKRIEELRTKSRLREIRYNYFCETPDLDKRNGDEATGFLFYKDNRNTFIDLFSLTTVFRNWKNFKENSEYLSRQASPNNSFFESSEENLISSKSNGNL